MDRNEKEKSEEEPWTGRRILGVAAAGAVAAAAGAFFVLSRLGDSTGGQEEAADDDAPLRPTRTMKGPGTGGEGISRDKFEADAKNYFKTSREKGPKAAVDAFK